MADFQLRVTAETQRAEKDLQRLDRTVNEATKDRKLRIDIGELNKSFSNVEKNIKEAGNAVQSFYRVSKNIPGIGERVKEFESLAKGTVEIAKNAPASAAALRENAKAGSILTNSLQTAGGAATTLIDALARTGLAIFAVKEAVGVLRGVFGGFFNETIGREIKLRETILKTQTTLASSSKVFRNGQEITDPYEKIVSLTGEVRKNIDSIRVRSLELAGVTSNDVIEVFGIVAQQVNQIGGGLKEAEDLAIQFSAALGTFGLPLYQARQEIGSILRGEITEDSYLAKSLLISSKDIEKAKTQAGGVVKFLEERLSAAVAGQKIAAQGFAGITSNIREIAELTTQAFGAGLLDPLLGGLTNVYTLLFRIAKQLQAIAKTAGTGLGQILANSLTVISGNSALLGGLGNATEGLANQIKAAVESAFQSLATDAASVLAPIQNIFEEVLKSVAVLAQGLSNLAVGFASIQIENFKALVQVFSNLTEGATIFAAGLGSILSAYGSLLQVPFVQYLSQISAQFKLLEAIGVKSAIQLAAVALTVLANWKPVVAFFQVQFARAVVAAGAVVAGLGAAFSQIAAVIAAFAATLAAAIPNSEALQASLTKLSASLSTTGASATEAGARLTSMAGASGAAASKLGSVVFNLIKFNLIILAVTGAITILIDLFGRWQRAKDKEVSDSRAEKSLALLATRYKNVGDNADAATKAAKNFHEAVVNARYQRAISEVEQLSQKLAELEEDMNRPVRWALDGWFKNWALNRIPEIKKQLENALKDRDKWARTNDRSNTEESIRIEAQNRVNLEKEIGDLRRQIDSDIFQQRQALAQKEVEIFRAAGELRIFQMEQANAKLIEGEEGASAAALESLNTYLSTRERGELDIEASKKSLAIEVANLERQIADYRFDMEKKIFELRKRAGENDIKSAQLRRQQLEAAAKIVPGGAVRGGAVVTNRNDPDGEQTGSDIVLKGGVGAAIQNPFSSLRITKVGQQGSGSGPSGRGFGNYVTGEAVLNGKKFEVLLGHLNETVVRVGDVLESGAVIGTQGITGRATGPHVSTHVNALNGGNAGSVLSAIENAWVKGGTIQSRALTEAPKVEALQSAEGIPDQSAVAERYADAVRGVASALERARALQEALTNAKTAAAFDAIAKAAFPKVALEEYDNQAIELQETLSALRGISADLYDPEQIRIAVEQKSKELIADRERKQILDEATKRLKENQITQAEFTKLTSDLTERQRKFNEQLAQEAEKRRRNLELTKQQNAVESLKRATGAIRFDVARAGVQAQATMAQAFAGDDSRSLRLIDAEQRIAEERIRLEQDGTKSTADVNRELTAFAVKTRAAADVLGALDEQVKAFTTQMATIRDVSKTLTDSYKGLAQSFLSGGNLKDAVAQMSQTITDKLVGIVLDSAFKPMEDLFVQTLKDVFRMQDPTIALQEQNNQALVSNTIALERVTAVIANSAGSAAGGALPGAESEYELMSRLSTRGPAYVQEIEGMLEQEFKGIGESLTQLGTVAETTGTKTDGAAKQGEKGFTKFLGGMMGVATGALAITGAIQAMQDSEGGTYGTLMGIAGILGGLGAIAGGIGGIMKPPGRAAGGPVSARRPYIVGEVGPELFIPGAGGTIIPHDQIAFTGAGGATAESGGSGMTVPFQQGGSSVSNAFSTINSTAIPFTKSTERMVAERSERETIAAINNPKPLDVRYESSVINNVEYVTAEQHQKGMAEAAERGRTLTLSALQNSIKSRRQVGLV